MKKFETQLVLPFAEREWIDMSRACKILGVSWSVVRRLSDSGLIRLLDFRQRGWKRINYQSLVVFCDNLRQQYAIVDRRPTLSSPVLRHRDADILPFPLADTIDAAAAAEALGFLTQEPIYKLVQEGAFEAYRLAPYAPWRISTSSFKCWVDSRLEGSQRPTNAYKNDRPSTPNTPADDITI